MMTTDHQEPTVFYFGSSDQVWGEAHVATEKQARTYARRRLNLRTTRSMWFSTTMPRLVEDGGRHWKMRGYVGDE